MSLLNIIESIPYPRTDKYDLGYIHEFYNDLFSPRKESVKALLEIGVQEGYSILFWRDFFVNADIYGVDIKSSDFLKNKDLSRIKLFVENGYDKNFVSTLPQNYFDIIIDDGPHTFESMVFYCENYLPLVKEGGLFILEDIINTSWTPKLLDLIDSKFKTKVIHMAGKAKTKALQDMWSNGLDVMVVEK